MSGEALYRKATQAGKYTEWYVRTESGYGYKNGVTTTTSPPPAWTFLSPSARAYWVRLAKLITPAPKANK